MTKNKMFFHMILASLVRRRSRMVVALLAIAIGAAILSGLVTIYYDIPRQMGAEFRNYGANMIFTPTGDSFTEEELEQGLSLAEGGQLIGAAPYRYEGVRIHEQPLMAAGTDMDSVRKTSPYWLVDGAWPQASGDMIVGKHIAEDLSLKEGDMVTVSYTREDAEADAADSAQDFHVSGILSTGGSEENYVYMSLGDMEKLIGTGGSYDLAEVSISADSALLTRMTEEITAQVPSIRASLVKRVTASETTVLSKLQALIFLVTVIVLALTMICVATTMTAVVIERRSEIGLRKAIGASDESIIREFMGEGILLGAVGGMLGAIVGFLFAQSVSVNVFGSSISFRPLLVPVTILVSVTVTAIACLMPIRRTTRIDPALVLKGE